MNWVKFNIISVLLFFGISGNAQDFPSLNYHPSLIGWTNKVFEFQSIHQLFQERNIGTYSTPNLTELSWKEFEFDVEGLPVFCRIEVHMEKAARIPIKFRLGEVQYVEKMEGKY